VSLYARWWGGWRWAYVETGVINAVVDVVILHSRCERVAEFVKKGVSGGASAEVNFVASDFDNVHLLCMHTISQSMNGRYGVRVTVATQGVHGRRPR
jgi:hypothetical protein